VIGSILRWWLAIEVISLIALPLTAFLFRHLPLRGYPFSKALGLLCVGYGGWLLAMLGLASFNTGVLVIALLAVALVGWRVGGRGEQRRELLAELRRHWGLLLAFELLFAAMLYGGLWLRWGMAWGPGINSTEKPMDMTFLSGILNSTIFPPHDPWLAGYAINYYYMGYVLIAALIQLSRVPLGEGFNLGLATILGMAAQMVAGLVATLILLSRPPDHEPTPPGRAAGRWAGLAAAALLGVLIVFGAGNQFGALQRIVGSSAVVALDAGQLLDALRQRAAGSQEVLIKPPFRAAERGVVSIIRPEDPKSFDWWWPSRAVWDDSSGTVSENVEVAPGQFEQRDIPQRAYAITEFPFFSFYLGDMHPHVLVLPFGLLAMALALATAVRPTPVAFLADRPGYLELLLSGLILVVLYAINSWDAPTYALLYAGALGLHTVRLRRAEPAGSSAARTWRDYGIALGSVALAGLVLLGPFLLTFRSLAGNQPAPPQVENIPLLSSLGKMLAVAPDHTGPHAFLAIFGLFFVLLLPYLLLPLCETDEPRAGIDRQSRLIMWGGTALALVVGPLAGFPLLALMPLAITLAVYAFFATEAPVRAFVLWAVAVAALVLFAVDLVYIRDFFNNRMNTIFKFYYQIWLIWGTLAAYAAWAFASAARRYLAPALVWLVPAAALLLGALVYPWATITYAHNEAATPTIDALGFLPTAAPDEAAAIAWITANTKPTDVVLTAAGEAYNETGRIATVTGRPTLLGWDGSHEQLWRNGSPEIIEEIRKRETDIGRIYGQGTPADEAVSLLKQYKVAYVYVGPKEREKYQGADGLGHIGGLEQVFSQGQVQLYRVR
jgi:YYY domain-containing protein